MVCLAVVNGYSTYTEYIELTCTVFMLFIYELHYKEAFYLQNFCSDYPKFRICGVRIIEVILYNKKISTISI